MGINKIAKQIFYNQGSQRVTFMPMRISNYAMITYILAMIGCSVLYSAHIMPIKWWIFGLVSVLGFFAFANRQTKLWLNTRPMAFTKKLFWDIIATNHLRRSIP